MSARREPPPSEERAPSDRAPSDRAIDDKLLGLIALSLVLVIDVATLLFAKRRLGSVMPVLLPSLLLTIAVGAFAWRRFARARSRDDRAP